MSERITSDPNIRFGKPCIRGTRLAVIDVLEYMAGGDSIEELLEAFPYIAREDVLACLAYAVERVRIPAAIAA